MSTYRYNKWGVWPEDIREYAGDDRTLAYDRLTRLEKYETKLDTDLIPIPYTDGSDYAGDSVTVSNYRAIWRDFESKIPELYRVSGGYSSYGLLVERSVLTNPAPDHIELVEVMRSLEDNYCLYDEELCSEVELEAQSEAWDSWIKTDYRRGLEDAHILEEDSEDTISDDILFETLRLVVENANLEWINETGNSAYIDIDRLVECTDTEDIEEAKVNVAEYNAMKASVENA